MCLEAEGTVNKEEGYINFNYQIQRRWVKILLTNQVAIKWCSRTKYHYIDKGYIFTKIGNTFLCDINDATKHRLIKFNDISALND